MGGFRIKHKATGLFYQPCRDGINLSKTGKVYHKESYAKLSFSGNSNIVVVYVRKNSPTHKKIETALDFQESKFRGWLVEAVTNKEEDWEIEPF